MAPPLPIAVAHETETERPSYTVESAALQLLDPAARDGMDRLFTWAKTHAADYGVRLEGAVIRRRRSLEDKEWVDIVIDFRVTGDSAGALRFWEAASEERGRLTRTSSLPTEMLAVSVDWR